jgi:hypothetical protein
MRLDVSREGECDSLCQPISSGRIFHQRSCTSIMRMKLDATKPTLPTTAVSPVATVLDLPWGVEKKTAARATCLPSAMPGMTPGTPVIVDTPKIVAERNMMNA